MVLLRFGGEGAREREGSFFFIFQKEPSRACETNQLGTWAEGGQGTSRKIGWGNGAGGLRKSRYQRGRDPDEDDSNEKGKSRKLNRVQV